MIFQRLSKIFHRFAAELSPLDAYALWAKSYPPEAHNGLMKIEEDAMLDLMPELKNKIVLDLACGTGRYILKAKEIGASMIHGLDFSLPMLSRARTVSHQLVLGDMTSLPFESASFDVIISGLSIGHVRNLTPVFCEISRVLRPNGVAVYSDIHPFGKLAGWKRKFKISNGQEYSIEHHFHLYKDHHFACHASGLQIEDIREPLIEGKHQWAGSPAILAIRVRKILS